MGLNRQVKINMGAEYMIGSATLCYGTEIEVEDIDEFLNKTHSDLEKEGLAILHDGSPYCIVAIASSVQSVNSEDEQTEIAVSTEQSWDKKLQDFISLNRGRLEIDSGIKWILVADMGSNH